MNLSIEHILGLPFSEHHDNERFRSVIFPFKSASVLNPDGSPNYIGGSAHRRYVKNIMS